MKKLIKTCSYDSNSVSLFDGDRKNEFGEIYCVAPAITQREVDEYWNSYIAGESGESI